MKRILSIFLLFVGLHSVAQKTEQLYLSGTDSKQTVQWDFFCTDGSSSILPLIFLPRSLKRKKSKVLLMKSV